MSRSGGAFYADLPHKGGLVLFAAPELLTFSANLVLTRNALGDYSYNRTAAGAETYQVVLSLADLKRLVESGPVPGFQEQFGVAAGTAGYPAAAAGIPPFTGATQLTPASAQPSKGIRITDCVVVYQVGVVSLTSASLSLNRTTFADVAAKTITNLPIDATALTLTANANPRVAVRAVTTPGFEVTDLSDLALEFAFVMANTGTMRVYALGFHCDFNWD